MQQFLTFKTNQNVPTHLLIIHEFRAALRLDSHFQVKINLKQVSIDM